MSQPSSITTWRIVIAIGGPYTLISMFADYFIPLLIRAVACLVLRGRRLFAIEALPFSHTALVLLGGETGI
jgi:hypothetical protein